jgi:cystathionine gamma-lyase/cystathionine beta-lyase/cystathionine gamma-lyase/homocysteine desulfhydrase
MKPGAKSSGGRRRKRSETGKSHGFATRTIHAGQQPDPTTGAVMPPVYLTSTYRQPGLGKGWPYDYARTINPTRSALERNLADLEGGIEARCFASGMSAITAVLHLLQSGDHVVVSRNVYGGTYRLFEGVLRKLGLDFSWVDTADLKATAAAVRPSTRMLFVETPTNPVLSLTDIAGAAEIAKRHRLILVVDNTFMSPYLQQPIALGAQIVVHSTTKFLNGHSDSVGGCVITTRKAHAEKIAYLQKTMGAVLSPMDSFLVLRGIKTLALRMERHDANGRQVARWLEEHPKVDRVHYPALRSHPQRALARRQMSGFGGMVSFDLGTLARARRLLGRVRLCALAESLGGVETLISHPASMTHASVPADERRATGVTDGLVRISVGIEEPEDILADLERALRSV